MQIRTAFVRPFVLFWKHVISTRCRQHTTVQFWEAPDTRPMQFRQDCHTINRLQNNAIISLNNININGAKRGQIFLSLFFCKEGNIVEEFTNVKRDMNGGGSYQSVSHTFSNGITVVNTTPHNINFQSPEGDVVTIPTSVKPGEKTGFAVVNASPIEKEIAPHVVDTDFTGNEQGQKIIDDIKNEFKEQDEAGNLMIVGSMIAANAYPDVKGMCPAPGFERVPPDQKRMSCEKFTQGDAKATPLENLSLDNTVTKQEIDDLADRIFEDFDRAVVAVMSEIPATIPFTNTHGQARGIG